jgi:argininosuccinate lyase
LCCSAHLIPHCEEAAIGLDPRIADGVYSVLTPAASAASRQSYGGTAPDQVRNQIARWKDLLK